MQNYLNEGFFRILWIYLRLGCLSFGGPAAHIGYFRDAFVVRRKWLSEEEFVEMIALCQAIPGPSSSQLGFAIGWLRGGFFGGVAAWLGFTLPSAFLMVGIGYGLLQFGGGDYEWIDGLLAATVAIVVSAVLGMAKTVCPDIPRLLLAVVCAVFAAFFSGSWVQVLIVCVGVLFGILLYRNHESIRDGKAERPSWSLGIIPARYLIAAFFVLLGAVLIYPVSWPGAFVAKHYEAGALVFGGGHVVLPLLAESVVATELMSEGDFLAGYGAAQAMPGPLFTLSAFNGTVIGGGLLGGLLALAAIFLPGMLLVAALLSSWGKFRENLWVKAALVGVNAVVVGLLLAALIDPVWPKGITTWWQFGLALVAFLCLERLKSPAWLVVLICGFVGLLL